MNTSYISDSKELLYFIKHENNVMSFLKDCLLNVSNYSKVWIKNLSERKTSSSRNLLKYLRIICLGLVSKQCSSEDMGVYGIKPLRIIQVECMGV